MEKGKVTKEDDVGSKKHLVLVHGACHGAWCWYKVIAPLRSSGFRVTALDMAASGIHRQNVEELRGVSDDFQPLMEFLEGLPPEEKVVLVGHSRSGVAVSLALEKFPEKIAVGVYVAAIMHGPNLDVVGVTQELPKQLDSYMDSHFTFAKGPEKAATSLVFGPNFLASQLYQLSPPEDLALATLLMRPTPMYENEVLLEETIVSKENYGSVPRVYIVLGQDKVIKEEYQRWMIENNPTQEVMVISDADHMAMFSKPEELCSCLNSIVQKYC